MTRKSRKDTASDEPHYEVGYGKPPKQHRFKQGQSGNPKGRKPRSVSIAGTLRKLALEQRTVRIGERIQSLSTLEIGLRRQIERPSKAIRKHSWPSWACSSCMCPS